MKQPMKKYLVLLLLSIAFVPIKAQYYYPYDDNSYDDDAPELFLQNEKYFGWYVSNMKGERISDYYEVIRPYNCGFAAAKDKIMGWCFTDGHGKRLGDYFEDGYPFHRGVALIKDKIMGWYLMNRKGERISDYHDSPLDFRPAFSPHKRPW